MLNVPGIDFRQIRTHRGSQHAGFEELCVGLFRSELGNPNDGFMRVEGSGGDGGVEAYLQAGPNRTVGIQAKYFEKLEPIQWKQIRKSILRACKTHPNLREYYVAVPLDRTPLALRRWKALQTAVKKKHRRLTLRWWGQ